jgi:hypothetical protein
VSNHPPVYWEAEVIFPEVKWWMRDVDHSPLSSVEVNLSVLLSGVNRNDFTFSIFI